MTKRQILLGGSTLVLAVCGVFAATAKKFSAQNAYFKTTSGICNGSFTAAGGTFSNTGTTTATIATKSGTKVPLYTNTSCSVRAYFVNH